MSLKELPSSERPRERLLKCGVEALSLAELLAIVLTTGTQGSSVLHVARTLICEFGGLEGLLEASVEELMEIKGIGKAKAIQLKAVFGIALKRQPPAEGARIGASEAYALLKESLSSQKQEMLFVVLKDVKEKLICLEKVGVGTLSEVLIHPREIFYPAVRHKASSFILIHNHPSGDPTPSKADLEMTRHLIQSSQVMGIRLDDHVIVGRNSFFSLQEKGLFRKNPSSEL